MSGIVWISSNEEVSAGASDRWRREIRNRMDKRSAIELTLRVPKMSNY
jgi:hypothetical protein